MAKFYIFLSCFLLPGAALWSQKTYTALRLEESPLLDGRPDDACWQQVTPTDIPLTSTPVFGQPALPSAVRLFYTHDALYIAASFSGVLIRHDGSQRDDPGLGDWFSIGLDTWNDDQNAFVFTVTAAGVQTEQRMGGNGTATAWDAVWQSAVARQADGWSVEIRLPFTALRFPLRGGQPWGLQFSRFDRHSGTLATWNPRQPLIGDDILQYGTLEGLANLQQRQRISAAVQGRVNQAFSKHDGLKEKAGLATLGIDGRWGFNSSSTLDVALLPGSFMAWRNVSCPYCSGDKQVNLFTNVTLPEPRQLLAEERPMFDKGGVFLAYPVLLPRNVQLPPTDFIGHYENSRIWSAAKFSTRLPGNVGLGAYSTLIGPSHAVVRNTITPMTPDRIQQVTGLSSYTLLTMEKSLANNSWISLTNASLVGAQPTRNNLSALDFQLRDASNKYQVTGNVQVNIPSVGKTNGRVSNQYQFLVGSINRTWTWQVSHRKQQFISPDILNSDPRISSVYNPYHYSAAQVRYRDFTAHGWRQNTSAYLQMNKDWGPKTGFANGLSIESGVGLLTRRFQSWHATLHAGLYGEIGNYSFNNLILYRRLSPPVRAALSFHSDGRKRIYYQVNARAQGNVGGEKAQIYHDMQFTWVVAPRLRLRMEPGGWIFSNATSPLYGIPLPGYYLRQLQVTHLYSRLELSWFCTRSFNLYGRVGYSTTSYSKERAFQLTADQQLVPFDYPFEKFSRYSDRQLELGLQWFFGPISQLRFQYNYYPNQTLNTFGSAFYFSPQSDSRSTQASLAFIYFLDGNKQR